MNKKNLFKILVIALFFTIGFLGVTKYIEVGIMGQEFIIFPADPNTGDPGLNLGRGHEITMLGIFALLIHFINYGLNVLVKAHPVSYFGIKMPAAIINTPIMSIAWGALLSAFGKLYIYWWYVSSSSLDKDYFIGAVVFAFGCIASHAIYKHESKTLGAIVFLGVISLLLWFVVFPAFFSSL